MTVKIQLACLTVLAAAMAPLGVAAQEAGAQTTIVVSAEHQRDWDRGNRLEAKGLEDIGKAQRDLVRRSADVVNYRNRRDTSNDRAENARRTFDNLTANTDFADPAEALRWAGQLEQAASDWAENTSRMKDADEDLERAMRRQTNAQADLSQAQSKIDEGRAMMAQAERASSLQIVR